jgi:hypothetical protein
VLVRLFASHNMPKMLKDKSRTPSRSLQQASGP